MEDKYPESSTVCVVIPLYKETMSDYEMFSFRRILEVYRSRKIIIICPQSIKSFATSLIDAGSISVYSFSDHFFKNIYGYNRLLLSPEFYESFKLFKYILICQTDVFAFSDKLDYWMAQQYDNIGAPIFEGYLKPTNKFKNGNNGGFCLRNVESCIRVLKSLRFRYASISSLVNMESSLKLKFVRFLRDGLIFNYKTKRLMPIINEDIFWSVIAPEKYPWFKVCDPRTAGSFAFDANPKLLYELNNEEFPMAIHAWWRYDLPFVKSLIQKAGVDLSGSGIE